MTRFRRSTLLVFLCLTSGMAAAEWHVDAAASAPGDGSAGAPFPSIQQAADRAQAGDLVRIHAGIYRETVVPAASGTASTPIVFAGPGDGSAVIDGSDPLTGWTRVPGTAPIWEADYPDPFVSRLNQAEQLFCDDEMLWTARTPDRPVGRGFFHPDRHLQIDAVESITDVATGSSTPWGPVAKGGARRIVFRCDALDDPAEAWPAGSTVGLHPRENLSWGFICVGPVESYADGRITAVFFTNISTESHAFSRVMAGTPFFLTRGSGAELDAPGEWYHDRAAGRVRVWLPDGGDPNQRRMTIKRRDYAVDLSERSHIEVRDLSIRAATVTTDNQFGDGVGMGAWLTHNRGSVDIPSVQGNATASYCTLTNLQISHLNHFHGTFGNYHGQWTHSSGVVIAGTHHVVHNCRIGATAGNGIVLFGTDHRITGNLIHDVDYAAAHASGIYISQTPGNTPGEPVYPDRITIDHNTLVAGGWGLIDGSSLYTSDPAQSSRIHHNLIDGAGLLTRDVGGIRFVGHTVDNPLRTGPTRIDHNIVRNVVAALGNPIYFDFCDDYVVDHNLIYDCSGGININDGNNLTVTNNTMSGFQSGVGGVMRDDPTFYNMRDCLVRNNITSASVLQTNSLLDPSYVADHNLTGAELDLYVDPGRGDYRLRSSASAAIDAGSTAVPHPGDLDGAPDLGCFERGHDDWIDQVGRPVPVQATPTGLVAGARGDGSVRLQWTDQTGGSAWHLVDRGRKTDHPNGGWEFITVGSTPPGVDHLIDLAPGSATTTYYRVRAQWSAFSPWATTAAGTMLSDTITFEPEQDYATGPLFGQGPWVADPYTGSGRDSTQVVAGAGGQWAEWVANESLIVPGDIRLVDPTFDPTASRVAFSLRLRMAALQPGDNSTALTVQVGGYAIWQKSTRALQLGIRRDGGLFAQTGDGFRSLGSLADYGVGAGEWFSIAGVLDYDRREVVDVSVGGQSVSAGWAFQSGHADLADGLWHLAGNVSGAAQAIAVDDLRLRIDARPVVWLSGVDVQLDESGDDGLVQIAAGRPVADDLPLSLTLHPGSTADLADLVVRDAVSGAVLDPGALVLPAGHRILQLHLEAVADGVAEGPEQLIWELASGAGFRSDPDPGRRMVTATIDDGGAGLPPVIDSVTAADDPVSGTTTELTVVASDPDGDDTDLTVSWSTDQAPTGAPAALFSPNGSSAAAITTVRFGRAGAYLIRATVRAGSGASSSATVAVTVVQTGSGLQVVP